MTSRARRVGWVVATFAAAAVAWAFTVQEIEGRGADLVAECQDIETRIEGCPNGACGDAAVIEADLAAAEARLQQLQADRATLDPCTTCQQADASIASAQSLAASLRSVVNGWDGQG